MTQTQTRGSMRNGRSRQCGQQLTMLSFGSGAGAMQRNNSRTNC